MTYTDVQKSVKDLNEAVTCLCEVVYDITTEAASLQREGRIHVEDSRELFDTVLRLAKEFEESSSSDDYEKDYLTEVWEFAERELLKEFPVEKQYRIRLTKTYEFFVDATSDEEAIVDAEANHFEYADEFPLTVKAEIIGVKED